MKKIREKLGESYLQPTGIPMITDAYNLPAKKIAHVVGPVIQGDVTRDPEYPSPVLKRGDRFHKYIRYVFRRVTENG